MHAHLESNPIPAEASKQICAFLVQELLFGWPTDAWSLAQLSQRAGIVLGALGLDAVPLETPLRHLSDGYKRRYAGLELSSGEASRLLGCPCGH